MRLLVLCLCIVVFAVSDTAVAKKTNNLYYFCTSTVNNQVPANGMQYILYTDIKQLSGDTSWISRLTKEWGNLVRQYCKNKNGCSSDLNIYESTAIAEEYRIKFKQRYHDDKNYSIKNGV